MSMGYKVSYLGLLATIIWVGQQKWLLIWELGSPGWCARKKMPQIQWWVLLTIFLANINFCPLYYAIWLVVLSVLISISLHFLPPQFQREGAQISLFFFFKSNSILWEKFFSCLKNSFPFLCWQINTCNGFYCDTFSPNKPYKPTIWTEAWSGWYVINILFIFAF